MFYRQKENKIISKILDHSGGVFSSDHGWGILGGRQGYRRGADINTAGEYAYLEVNSGMNVWMGRGNRG
jgi:hypothetical protein